MKKYHTINGTLEKRFRPRKFVTGVQSVGARPQAPVKNLGKDILSVGTSTAAGVAAGGGTPLSIATGAAGLITGLASVIGGNKEKEEQFQADLDLWKGQKNDALQGQIFNSNEITRQAGQPAAKGRYATGTEAIEVERNELIFSISPIGKWNLKADVGPEGKTHKEGGVDYQAVDGDVIIPGDKRTEVLKAYKKQDIPTLERIRRTLPKDTKVAQDGLNKIGDQFAFLNQYGDKPEVDPQKQFAFIKEQIAKGLLPPEYALQFMQQNPGLANEQVPGTRGYEEQVFRPEDSALTSMQRSLMEDMGLQFDSPFAGPDAASTDPTTLGVDRQARYPRANPTASPNMGGQSLTKEEIDRLWGYIGNLDQQEGHPSQPASVAPTAVKPSAGVQKPVAVGTANINSGIPGFNNSFKKDPFDFAPDTPFKLQGLEFAQNDVNAQIEAKAGNNGPNFSNIAGYAAQGFSSLSKLFPGEAETQTTPGVNLDNIKYTDTSDRLRQQSNVMERVDASNARNVSGGNIQNYLANRRQAGIANFRRQEGIESQEYKNRLGVARENVGINNQETMINSRLAYQDSQVNAQNRGARRSYIDQGISELGALGGSFARDSNANAQQEDMLRLLESIGLYDRLGQFQKV